MNLHETIQSLEQNNIQTALDIGVHQRCDINSNCPIAVELRRIILDSGVTLEQLLEGYAASQGTPPEATAIELPQFNGRATIRVAGQSVVIDYSDTIRGQLGEGFVKKRLEFESMGNRMQVLGRSLYSSYLDQIYQLRNTKTLPQLAFSVGDLLKANCLITTDNTNYVFLFPRHYKPQWIITNGVRYKIADEDIETIKRNIHIAFTISKESKILKTRVLGDSGRKLQHYHGNNWDDDDCWGNVPIPERWDKTLKSLSNLVTQLMGSLATVNKDSILVRHPDSMPRINDLFDRSTKLGEEGHTEEREQPRGGWGGGEATEEVNEEGNITTAPARGWGARRQQAPAPTQEPPPEEGTPEHEWFIRFGVRNERGMADYPDGMGVACGVCGTVYGTHYTVRDRIICPRDHHPQ